MTDLADVARELYALLPDQFTAARNAHAKTIPEAKKLVKPSASAWLINALAREHRDTIDALIELGEQLIDAQADRDRDLIMSLSKRRRALVSEAVATAKALAEQLGNPVAAGPLGEVEQTLNAALSDPDAASAVVSGVLVRPLSSNGLDPVDLSGALAIEGAAAVPRASKPRVDKEDRARAQREAAQRAVDEATAALEDARDELAEVIANLGEAQDRRDSLVADREELQAQLDALDDQLANTDSELRFLRRTRESAERVASRASAALERARANL